MCSKGRCLFCNIEFGTLICLAIETVVFIFGSVFAIDLLMKESEKDSVETIFIIFLSALFIACLLNILFNIYLVDAIVFEKPMRLIVYLVFSIFKDLEVVCAIIVVLPYFKYYEDILVPSACFLFLEICLVICVYGTYQKFIQKEMDTLTPLMPEQPVFVAIEEKKCSDTKIY